MDLHSCKQVAINLSKKNKGVEHTIWLNVKAGEFYISHPREDGGTQLVEDETSLEGVEIGAARLKKFELQSRWLNGNEFGKDGFNTIVTTLPIKGEKSETQKIEQKELITKNTTSMKAKVKPAKKAAKSKSEKVFPKKVGEKKTMTVKALIVLLTKAQNYVYRQSLPDCRGVITLKRAKAIKNVDQEIPVIIIKKAT